VFLNERDQNKWDKQGKVFGPKKFINQLVSLVINPYFNRGLGPKKGETIKACESDNSQLNVPRPFIHDTDVELFAEGFFDKTRGEKFIPYIDLPFFR
jgi:hypothetical protein